MGSGISRFNQPVRDAARMAPDVSESRLNRLGYQLLGADKAQAALAVFELNVELYGSANSYDSLGEVQMVMGDLEASKRSYRRSLELNPGNGNARSTLAEMGDASP